MALLLNKSEVYDERDILERINNNSYLKRLIEYNLKLME